MNKLITISVIAVILSMTSWGSNAYADKSPYDSGFDHGCKDSHIEDADDRYINQDEKGPAYHTSAFMNGYYDGFKECGYDNGVLIQDIDDHSNTQEQNQAAYTNQRGECGVILIGDCNIGQASSNNFASDADN